ncbi:MAG TPA: porin [Pseudoalteromonas sp.]|uniref:Porin n=1 Tax=marine sediment metagenome TaxID=412755 RepID=A0A0F9UZY0_9ZZZZ|nr:DcaP family trimeric outer membrane transporter [Pseudoalteromonas sp.]HDY91480.1 porin [Pseudoalteromonas sp.]HDZ34077.1 porin [Pseudoalteromonas sp.]
MNYLKIKPTLLATLTALVTSNAYASPLNQTDITIGGYIKADLMLSHYSNGAPDTNSISRQSYIPGTISGDSNNGKNVLDFHARESRFNIAAQNDIDGVKVSGFIELDFMTHFDGSERIDNGYSPRLRLAYLNYDKWTIGQNWSTFQNPSVLPDNLDFSSAADGSPFIRQGQVRYTNGKFQVSLENPESTFTSVETESRVTSGSGWLPDVVLRYNFLNENNAQLNLSSVFRRVSLDSKVNQDKIKADEFGYGVSLAGKLPIGNMDDFRFTITAGEGLGRYAALNYINAATLNAEGDTKRIRTVSGFMAYRHFWNEKLRSSLTLSGITADNPTVISNKAINKSSYSGYVNLLYSPTVNTTFGVELMHANNKQENGSDVELTRLMFSAKYSF